MNVKRITRISLFTVAALVLSVIESALPPLIVFAPGAKMGLSNVAILIALVMMSPTDAYFVQIVRCLLAAIFGGVTSLMYSLPAGLLSLTAMALVYRFLCPHVGLIGISFIGAVVHNLSQVAIAGIIVQTSLWEMLPFYMLASIIAGLFVGITSHYVIKFTPISVFSDKSKC